MLIRRLARGESRKIKKRETTTCVCIHHLVFIIVAEQQFVTWCILEYNLVLRLYMSVVQQHLVCCLLLAAACIIHRPYSLWSCTWRLNVSRSQLSGRISSLLSLISSIQVEEITSRMFASAPHALVSCSIEIRKSTNAAVIIRFILFGAFVCVCLFGGGVPFSRTPCAGSRPLQSRMLSAQPAPWATWCREWPQSPLRFVCSHYHDICFPFDTPTDDTAGSNI